MDPISILSSIKLGVSAGKSLASLSKEIGNFFDATDNAKKKLQKKGITTSDVNSVAYDRWSSEIKAAQAEKELQEWVCDPTKSGLGPSHWQTLLKIRREVLQEKREAEAQARRDAIQQQEWIITIVGILVLLIFTFIGSAGYLHYLGWIDVRDWLP
ncbi:MAG: hypothetical protein P8L17_01045 [Methylophilaceae bacterium]|nr:hypothetical protein [Methylophilaceae bacterium]